MKVLDVNVLVYAHHVASPEHSDCRSWLGQALAGSEPVGLPLVTALGFVRLVSNPRVLSPPVTVDAAMAALDAVRSAPVVEDIGPLAGHWRLMAEMATEVHGHGPDMTDVHLAALAVERGATLVSHDRGFRRFSGLDLVDPVADG